MKPYFKCRECGERHEGWFSVERADIVPKVYCPSCGVDLWAYGMRMAQRVFEYDQSELCSDCGGVIGYYEKPPTCNACTRIRRLVAAGWSIA